MINKHCFIYNKTKDEFIEVNKQDVIDQFFSCLGEEPNKIEELATTNGSDAVLLFDNNQRKWILAFAKGSSIILQRTVRRRADSASRSGIKVTSGERIGTNTPLNVLSNLNVGDLTKSVQEKYLPHSDLRGQ